jgi:hypothetical protein
MFGGSRFEKTFGFTISKRKLEMLIMERLPRELDLRLGGGSHAVKTGDHVKFEVTNGHPRHTRLPHRIEITIGEGELHVMFLTSDRIPEGVLNALGLEGILEPYLNPGAVGAAV